MEKKQSNTSMGGIFALIVALTVLGVMKGKLKQASRQSAAANYLVGGSFALDLHFDQFLYEETEKRKIENNDTRKK